MAVPGLQERERYRGFPLGGGLAGLSTLSQAGVQESFPIILW